MATRAAIATTNARRSRFLDEYGLHGLDAELEDRWTTEGGRRMSLRDRADYFNREVLAAVLAKVDAQQLDGEAENTYCVLTSDDVSNGTESTSTLRSRRSSRTRPFGPICGRNGARSTRS